MVIIVELSFAFVCLENGKNDGKRIKHIFSLQISFDTFPVPTHTSRVTLETSPNTHTVHAKFQLFLHYFYKYWNISMNSC